MVFWLQGILQRYGKRTEKRPNMTTANKAHSGNDTTPVEILNDENLPEGLGIPYYSGETKLQFVSIVNFAR
jgi:hypothetical protein